MTSSAPSHVRRGSPARCRAAAALLCSAGLLAATPAAAQLLGFGSAPGSTLGGLRGTVDATGSTPTLSGQGPVDASGTTGPLAGFNTARQAKIGVPKLRNGALPDRYPVPLPALEAYPRSLRALRGGLPDGALAVPNTNVAALPVEPRRVIRPDDAPFAPIGYEAGSLRLSPYVEQGLGYDSNPDQDATKVKASPYSRTEAGLGVKSQWSAHELTGAIRGAYDDFFRNRNASRPDADGVLDLRLDVTRTTSIDTEARFAITTQRPGSPELNVDVQGRPLVEAFGGTLGVTQGIGRFSVGLHALVDRTAYDNGTLSNGHPVDLAYQNVTDVGPKLRIGYDLKPGLQPFAEVGYDRRIHDATIDPGGYRRDSDGLGGRVGASFEFWPQLTGTAAVGYATRTYEDPRLAALTGPTADAAIVWAATPLTTLTLNGSTSFNETTVIGSSGIETRVVGVALTHALFRYLTLTASVVYQNNDYRGAAITENGLTESFKAEYHLSRSIVLTGTLSHQSLKSTVVGSDYTQNVALLGLRIQH